jgi:DNA-binding NarL/FixJ family response regulator
MNVVIVDDHPLMLAGLALALERERFHVVGRASTASEAIEVVARTRPDAIVLDVLLPDGNGVQVCRAVQASSTAMPVILMLSTYTDPLVAHAARRAGARGLVSKEVEPMEIARLLRAFSADPNVTAFGGDRWPDLTERERSVLRCIVRGRTYAEAAADLWIAEATVKDYAARLLAKFDAHDRYDLLEHLGSLADALIEEI